MTGLLALIGTGATPQASPVRQAAKVHRIHTLWQATLERQSNHQDTDGRFLAPWTKASVRISFSKGPTSGRTVTVVPIGRSLPVVASKISDIKQWRGGCDGHENEISWDGLVPVGAVAYLNAPTESGRLPESPFDVVVIYPAVPYARSVTVNSLSAAVLPPGVPKSVVTAAVDLTGTGKPDLLVATYCCQSNVKTPANENCDLSCQNYYQKRAGKWIVVRRVRPC